MTHKTKTGVGDKGKIKNKTKTSEERRQEFQLEMLKDI